MCDLEHPDIIRANLTGYAEEPRKVGNCAECDEEIIEGETIYTYDDYAFCSRHCLVDYLINCGTVERMEAE